jgi:hypothetical protein
MNASGLGLLSSPVSRIWLSGFRTLAEAVNTLVSTVTWLVQTVTLSSTTLLTHVFPTLPAA